MTQKEFTFGDLKGILVSYIGVPANQVVDDPNMSFEDMGLDSLALIEIQLAMQKEYDITIPDEDTQHIVTIGQAIDYTNRRLQERE